MAGPAPRCRSPHDIRERADRRGTRGRRGAGRRRRGAARRRRHRPVRRRYRKENTGGLDDAQLRKLDERLAYLRDLNDRRAAIVESVRAQGKLTPDLAAALAAPTPRRASRTSTSLQAQAPVEGADRPGGRAGAPGPGAARQARGRARARRGAVRVRSEGGRRHRGRPGGRQGDPDRASRGGRRSGRRLRADFWRIGQLASKIRKGKAAEGAKFSDYFDWSERLERMPSHRILAILRGEREGILDVAFTAEGEDSEPGRPGPFEAAICSRHRIAARGRPGDAWLMETVRTAWRTKIRTGSSRICAPGCSSGPRTRP